MCMEPATGGWEWILVGEIHKALGAPMGQLGVPEGEVSQVACGVSF